MYINNKFVRLHAHTDTQGWLSESEKEICNFLVPIENLLISTFLN